MDRTRSLLIGGLLAVAMLAWATPADAGVLITLDAQESCGESGDYEIVYTVTNDAPEVEVEADLTVVSYEVDGVEQPPPTFAPNPVQALGGTSTATVSVPGTTTSVFLEVDADVGQGVIALRVDLELDGDCEPAPTTTSTTVPAEPVTPAPAALPQVVTPAFTG